MNPSLPNVIVGDGPLLEKRTKSRMIAENLNAMHAARVDFIKNESNEKLRRALLHQLRSGWSRCQLFHLFNETLPGKSSVISPSGEKHGGHYAASLLYARSCLTVLLKTLVTFKLFEIKKLFTLFLCPRSFFRFIGASSTIFISDTHQSHNYPSHIR